MANQHHACAAAGVAVSAMMLGTTFLVTLVMLIVWGVNEFVALSFLLVFGEAWGGCSLSVAQGAWSLSVAKGHSCSSGLQASSTESTCPPT